MPLYLITQTRSFRERYVVEAEDKDEALSGANMELWSESELGVTSDLEDEEAELLSEDEWQALIGGGA